jgi:hypothetical protein
VVVVLPPGVKTDETRYEVASEMVSVPKFEVMTVVVDGVDDGLDHDELGDDELTDGELTNDEAETEVTV